MVICNKILTLTELRNWTLLILAIIGAIITIRTYINSIKQRKIDNTFKTLDFLRRHIGEKEIEKFIELFQANNELKGIEHNKFVFDDGREDTVEYMFSEGGCGNGEIHNMVELLNLISPTLKNLEESIIWFEYGQIMSKIYDQTQYLENIEEEKGKTFYSDFNTYMRKNKLKMLLPMKYYTYGE